MAAQQGRSARRGDEYSVRYGGEPLSEARTPLEDFFRILLGPGGKPGQGSILDVSPWLWRGYQEVEVKED